MASVRLRVASQAENGRPYQREDGGGSTQDGYDKNWASERGSLPVRVSAAICRLLGVAEIP